MENYILIDYGTLRLIWWFLLGALLVMFAIMDGFDLGLAALMPIVTRTDMERRILLNIVAPVWEGNQVWLITAGAVIFAAWPWLYATAFSGFYLAMMLLLVTLILRPVGFKYRSKFAHTVWRACWDYTLIFTGWVAPFVFGVAVSNVLMGVPFSIDPITLHIRHHGSFLDLFHGFSILCGLLAITLCLAHGSIVIAWKTEGTLSARTIQWGRWLPIVSLVLFLLGGWYLLHINGWLVVSDIDPNALSMPLEKEVAVRVGGWYHNYLTYPLLGLVPGSTLLTAFLAVFALQKRKFLWAFLSHALMIGAVIFTFGIAMFPFLLPSKEMVNASLTIWDASSSHLTLWLILLAAAFFLPIIISYTAFIYRVMRGTVNQNSIEDTPNSY